MNKEYVIWTGTGMNEVIACTKHNGKKITTRKKAKWLMQFLIHKTGCKNFRIQEIDFTTDCNFTGTLQSI